MTYLKVSVAEQKMNCDFLTPIQYFFYAMLHDGSRFHLKLLICLSRDYVIQLKVLLGIKFLK